MQVESKQKSFSYKRNLFFALFLQLLKTFRMQIHKRHVFDMQIQVEKKKKFSWRFLSVFQGEQQVATAK